MPIIPGYNTATSVDVQKLTDMIGQLRSDVDNLMSAARVNQLNYSSINDTALPIFGTDSFGVAQLKARLGMQPDGTYAITYHNGDAPPNPINIGVANRQLGILVTWDGTFAGNAPRPNDFDRLDVYIDTTSGFTPSVNNLMGSLFTDSALFIGADVTPHYVKVATVNTSGVASFPSFETPVTPLPATQLAAGSVTAVTLDAELVLATDIIIGNQFSSHITLDSLQGIQLYAGDGTTVLVDLNIITGGAIFTGTVETKSGPDKVIITDNSGNPEIQLFRNPSGTNKAYITAIGTSLNSEIDLVLHSGPDPTHMPNREFRQTIKPGAYELTYADVPNGPNRGGRITAGPFSAAMDIRNEDGSGNQNGGSVVVDNNDALLAFATTGYIGSDIVAQANNIDLTVFDSGRLGNAVAKLHLTNSGDTTLSTTGNITLQSGSSVIRQRETGGLEPELMNIGYDVGIRWTNNNKMFVINTSGGARAIAASSFDVVSSKLLKRNIQTPTMESRKIIKDIKVKAWNYSHEPQESTPHLFPLAEELSSVLPDSVNDDGTVDLRDIVGFLLQLCQEQEEELKSIRQELNQR